MTGTDGSQTGTAGFQGNFTVIQGPPQGDFLMVREADCSLGLITVASSTDPGTVTQHYEQILHQQASLKTTPNVFAKGCRETSAGISSRPGVFVGETASNVLVFAAVVANNSGTAVVLFNSNNGLTQTTDTSLPSATTLATADLNGDTNNDLVVVNGSATSPSVSVMLASPNGTFQTPVSYPTAGAAASAAVIDDVNGDGHPDIVVVSATDPSNMTSQQISVLLGKGDGTFEAAQSFAAPILTGSISPGSEPIVSLITADVNGDGKKDIVCSNGLVFLGKGDGTFTAVSAPAFPYPTAVSSEGPNLASGDLNNDGKLDLVLNNGITVSTWMGNGDGTFTAGKSYASIEDTGFVTVTDIDGDGNQDIYVGLADNGVYGGDDSNQTESYVLMGNGDGTFQGAPLAPGIYGGNNLVDLNGDGIPDLLSNATGVLGAQPANPGFAVSLGSGKGTFNPTSTVTAPDSFTVNGYKFTGVASLAATSFAVADVNGDGKPDLAFVDNGLTAINPGSGLPITYPYPIYFVALGNGDGTFQTPVPYPFPQIAPASGFDNTLTVGSLEIADFNKDGHADLIFTYNDFAGGTGVNPYLQGFVVLTGAGNGTFSTKGILTSTYSSTTAPGAAVDQITNLADFNGDAVPDLVVLVPNYSVAAGATTQVNVFLANGDGTFKAPTPVTVAANAYGVPVLADFNNDGKPDLAFLAETSSSQAEFAIALGNGNGTFANAVTSNLTGGDAIRSSALAAADFNGDGDIDLALIDNNDYSGIFYGNGAGSFTSVPESGYLAPKDLINLAGGAPAIAVDLNKDGKPDVLAGNVILINSPVPATSTTTTPTTTTLSASSTTISAGSSVTLTAAVAVSGGSGTPTGTVTFMNGSTTLGTGTLSSTASASYATSSLPAGSQSITAVYSGDTNFSASTSTAITIVVNAGPPLAATSTALTASATSATSGTSITFTAKVAETSGSGIPSGTVTFYDGSTSLGTGALSSGTGTYSSSSLSVGTHSITASYAGDAANAASTSSAVSVVITAAAPDFTILLSSSSGTAAAGSSATSTVSITPSAGFNQQVAFACTGLPGDAACSFSPTTVTPAGTAAVTSTLTINTNVASAVLHPPAEPGRGPATALAFLGGGGFLGLTLWRRRKNKGLWYAQLGLALMILTASTIIGCGSSGSMSTTTPKGTYQISVTATAGSTTHSAPYSLIVQ